MIVSLHLFHWEIAYALGQEMSKYLLVKPIIGPIFEIIETNNWTSEKK